MACFEAESKTVTIKGGRAVYFQGPAPSGVERRKAYAWAPGAVTDTEVYNALYFNTKAILKAGQAIKMTSVGIGRRNGPHAGKILVAASVQREQIRNIRDWNGCPCD